LSQVKSLRWSYEVGAGQIGRCTYLLHLAAPASGSQL